MKSKDKIRTFLRCERIVPATSKSGNNMFVAYFRDKQCGEYKHYISFNRKSQVWTRQLLLGSGINFDTSSLEMDIIYGEDPFEYCRGRLYEVVWTFDNKFGFIVNEIYSLEDVWRNKEHCIELYNKYWYKNMRTFETGYNFSQEDYAAKWYGEKE